MFGAGRDFVVCLDDLQGNCFIKLRISNDKHWSLYDKMKKAIVQKIKSDSIVSKKNEVILFLPNSLNTIDKIQATVQLFGLIITITAPMIYNQKGA
ncbi:type II restriction enzyme, methylase subunits [Bacillus sp. OxB-1]|nr:type II restriction enzyme, methylase subunits [Bacillus sp. OxB-1]